MYKKILVTIGVVSVGGLVIYNIKQHRDNRQILQAVIDLAQSFEQFKVDMEFASIVENYDND